MKNCFKVIFFLISTFVQSQICPLKDGDLIIRHSEIFFEKVPNIAEVESIHSDVFSVSDGKVISIISLSNIYTILIKREAEEDQFYVYSNLSSVTVQKGDMISVNQILGKAVEYNGKYSIEFQYRILSERLNPREVINCREVNIYY